MLSIFVNKPVRGKEPPPPLHQYNYPPKMLHQSTVWSQENVFLLASHSPFIRQCVGQPSLTKTGPHLLYHDTAPLGSSTLCICVEVMMAVYVLESLSKERK